MGNWLRRIKIKEPKKVRPFRRFDNVSENAGFSSYEKFVFFILFVFGIIEILYGLLIICGIGL